MRRGNEIGNLEQGEPINLRIEVEALRDIPLPSFGWMIKNASGLDVSGFGTHLSDNGAIAEMLRAGERAQGRRFDREPARRRAATSSSSGCAATAGSRTS